MEIFIENITIISFILSLVHTVSSGLFHNPFQHISHCVSLVAPCICSYENTSCICLFLLPAFNSLYVSLATWGVMALDFFSHGPP